MHIDAVPLKQPAQQNHLGCNQPETRRDRGRVFAQHAGPFVDYFHRALIAVHGRFKNDRSQARDVHLVRGLRPPDQFIAAIQRESPQNARGELRFAPVQIVFAQNETERLEGQKITAAGVAQNMAPSACLLSPFPPATRDRSARPGIDRDAIAFSQSGGEPGISIAPGHDFCGAPDFRAEPGQGGAILVGGTAGEEHSHPICCRGHLLENRAQTFRRDETKIRGWQFALIDHTKGGIFMFDQDPRGLGAAAFHTENALAHRG